MYALYVKNKPVSDRLLAENGKFFQTKQAELDLASYLLKPVQRLGKYSLFLDGISRTNGPKSELIKARTIIQFQVRPNKNKLAIFLPKLVIFDLKISNFRPNGPFLPKTSNFFYIKMVIFHRKRQFLEFSRNFIP